MAQPRQTEIRNRLLAGLAGDAFGLLQPHLEPVTLNMRDPLHLPDEPSRFVYFLDEGIGSVLMGPERNAGVEIGLIGRDGFIGTSVVLGAAQSPYFAFIQVPGHGHRIEEAALRSAMAASPVLHSLLLLYVHVYLVQVASTAHANADFTAEERLARWLLMCHDRVDGDEIAITHEFLALMLGVRRPGVTVATHVLEGEGMIRAKRGLITIRDRDKLKQRAGESYGLAESEYERVIGRFNRVEGSNLLQFPTGTAVGGSRSGG